MALGLALTTTGCSLFHRPAAVHVPTYALVVSVNNGQPPTDAQWAELQKRFALMLGARGFALVSDPAAADRIIHVRFVPDEEDPLEGTAYVVSVKPNSLAYASTTANSSVGTFGYSMNSAFGSSDYSDSYSYYTPTRAVYHPGTPPPNSTPTNPHPTKPEDCPPGTTPPINFVGHYPAPIITPPSDGHHAHPHSDPGYSRSDSNYSRSDSNYSRSESNYPSSSSSSSSDSSSSSSGSSSSYSAPSYSPPAESAPSSNRTEQPF